MRRSNKIEKKRFHQMFAHAMGRNYITAGSFALYAGVSHRIARKWLERATERGLLLSHWYDYRNVPTDGGGILRACRYMVDYELKELLFEREYD